MSNGHICLHVVLLHLHEHIGHDFDVSVFCFIYHRHDEETEKPEAIKHEENSIESVCVSH